MALAAASAIAALASPVLQPQAPLQPQAQAPQAWKPWTPDPKLAPGPSHVCPKQNFLHWMTRLGTHPDAQLGDAVARGGGAKKLTEIFASLPPAASCAEQDPNATDWKAKAFQKRWPASSQRGPILDMASGTTGTRFVDCVFSSLGFRTMHNFKCPEWGTDCTKDLDATDFVSDSPLPGYVEDAIKAHRAKGFPGMLLTVRDPKEWAVSRIKHLPAQSSEYIGCPPCLRQSMYSQGLLKPISDVEAVTVPQLVTWAYSMCVATSKYKEYPDDHIMLLNLFRTDMTEVEKDAHLVKQLTHFLAGPAASVVGASARAQSLRNLQVHAAQVNQSVANCSSQASSVTGNHVSSQAEETTTRLQLVRAAPSKYEWEWDEAGREEAPDAISTQSRRSLD